jgi:hypothetical protein
MKTVGKNARPFLLLLSEADRSDVEIRANVRGISSAEYIRQALAAVASVGGPEEFSSRLRAKPVRDQAPQVTKRTKGKKK